MISLKKFLDPEDVEIETDNRASALLRALWSVLEASVLHAIDFDPEECSAYRFRVRQICGQLEQATENREVLALVGEAIESMESHNRAIKEFIRNLSSEKQSNVDLMMESLIKLSLNSDAHNQNLRQIGKQLEKTCQLSDIRGLKRQLAKHLEDLNQEVARQEEQFRAAKAKLTEQVYALAPSEDEVGAYDNVTGLPGVNHAECHMRELAAAGKCAYAVPFYVKNLEVVNQRFGFAAGDEILALFSQHISLRLANADQLFRWRGPCFVAILERTSEPDNVREEVRKIASVNLEHSFEISGRSMLFKVSTAWELIPIMNAPDVAEILRKINAFAAVQTPGEAEARSLR
jgi:GGDEF domain-containing protein